MVAGFAAFVVLGLGTGAVLCKTSLDCHRFHPAPDDASADRASLEKQLEGAATLPTGYTEAVVASGFVAPTDFAFLPDGRLLVAEKAGTVKLVDPSAATSSVALDIRNRVDDSVFRGLLTVAVDPDFAVNRYMYVVYTPPPVEGGGGEHPTVERLSRFRLSEGGKATAERILIGTVTTRSCTDVPATADCLPSDRDHNGAQVDFASDGSIFLATGDGGGYDDQVEPTALRAQDVDSLAGKVLHITREGKGLAGNPFAGADLDANRAKVWALGLRNPFRLVVDPAELPVVADVGVTHADEVDVASRGANLGWPCWEADRRHPVYASTPLCKRLFAAPPHSLTVPLVVFPHPDAASITGGDFGPKSFPPETRGAYFVGDWVKGWLRTVRISSTGTAGRVRPFATNLPGPSAIHAGPDGALYYAGLNAGEIRRITASP